MDATADRGAFAEAVVFLSSFDDLPDPRQRGKVVYPLDEVLLLALLGVLAGAETFVDIARFGAKKLALLRRFRPFRDGTPSHDHLGDIFAAVDAEAFQRCFVAWVASLVGTPAEVIAIDGKTSRRSGQKTSGKAPLHMVSAFATRQRLVLGQVKVGEKSNEIVALPKLLDLMAVEGAVVTIDAIGCQRDIAQTILDQKGDHGRIETRNTTVLHDVSWLQERHDWPGLNGVVIVDSIREIGRTIERETRLFTTALSLPAKSLAVIVRGHWAVENSLHWVMDMVFRDDECRIRTDHAPANFTTIKHMALNLTRRAPGRTPSASGERSPHGTTTTSPA